VKYLAFILSVFVLLLATIPCCLADDCTDEEVPAEQTADSDKEQSRADANCGLCSPFYSCHTCPGFAFTNTTPKIPLVLLADIKSYITCNQNSLFTFAASIWQPPKIA
jgi:hypothetical protein